MAILGGYCFLLSKKMLGGEMAPECKLSGVLTDRSKVLKTTGELMSDYFAINTTIFLAFSTNAVFSASCSIIFIRIRWQKLTNENRVRLSAIFKNSMRQFLNVTLILIHMRVFVIHTVKIVLSTCTFNASLHKPGVDSTGGTPAVPHKKIYGFIFIHYFFF
jgi:hypothetical protein